jgi:hypothetical protein
LKTDVFWVVALCSLVEVTDVSVVLAASIIALLMETASSSETTVNVGSTLQKTAIFIHAVVRT